MPKKLPVRKEDEKWCCGCKSFQPKTSFASSKNRKGGLGSWCKSCHEVYERVYAARRKELRGNGKREGALWYWRERARKNGVNCNPLDLKKKYEDSPFCLYCGMFVRPDEFSIDHFISKKRCGGNEIGNLVISCHPCNRFKGSMNGDEFIEFLLKYASRVLANKAQAERKLSQRERLSERTPEEVRAMRQSELAGIEPQEAEPKSPPASE